MIKTINFKVPSYFYKITCRDKCLSQDFFTFLPVQDPTNDFNVALMLLVGDLESVVSKFCGCASRHF